MMITHLKSLITLFAVIALLTVLPVLSSGCNNGSAHDDGNLTPENGQVSYTATLGVTAAKGRGATVIVAASNSSTADKAQADYVCDGIADTQLQEAIKAGAGGRVRVCAGTYAPRTILDIPAGTWLEGDGKSTVIAPVGKEISRFLNLLGDNIIVNNMKIFLAPGTGSAGNRPDIIYGTGRTRIVLENLWLVGDNTPADDGGDSRQNGIYLVDCTHSRVTGCDVRSNRRHGINIYGGSDNSIEGNTTEGNLHYGVLIDTAKHINVINNCCMQNNFGIFVFEGNSCTITGNTCHYNVNHGIALYHAPENTVTGNTCNDNGHHGIVFNGCDYGTITGNTTSENWKSNINLFRSSCCVVSGNMANASNIEDGITVEGDETANADYNTITGNVCTGNCQEGIVIVGGAVANKNSVIGNIILKNREANLSDGGIATEIAHNVTELQAPSTGK